MTIEMISKSSILPAVAALLTLAALALLFAAAPPALAGGPGSVPGPPEGLAATAVHAGIVDIEWNEAADADAYEVQVMTGGTWILLPGEGIEIAFYGAGAIVRNLPYEGRYYFSVRARNDAGASEWSAHLFVPATGPPKQWADVPEPVNAAATGAPVIVGRASVGETLTADTSGIEDANGLERVQFRYQWVSSDGITDADIEGATADTYTLEPADKDPFIKVRVSFTDRGGFQESLTSEATAAAAVTDQPNRPATGQPAITGTAQVGETLTAETSGIVDDDGLSNVVYSYQWVSDDAEITGETGSSYTLADADEGKAIKVRVSFSDNWGNEETLTSAATAAVIEALVVTVAPKAVTVDSGATVSLNATASAPEGAALTYTWTAERDLDSFADASQPVTVWTAPPRGANWHPINLTLTVTNEHGVTDTDVVVVKMTDTAKLEYVVESVLALPDKQDPSMTVEEAHPWMRQAWDYASKSGIYAELDYSFELKFRGTHIFQVTHECSHDTELKGCESQGLIFPTWMRDHGDDNPAPDFGYWLHYVAHELAHIFTKTTRISRNGTDPPRPDLSGIAEFYMWRVHECSPPSEVLAETLEHRVDPYAYLIYWRGCKGSYKGSYAVPQEATDVVKSILQGEYPQWFLDNYRLADGRIALRRLWRHMSRGRGDSSMTQDWVWLLRDAFGGRICDPRATTRSITRNGPYVPNPWSIGDDDNVGCDNQPANGAPAIGGAPRVGQTLTVDTSAIEDADGLGNVSYSHQWIRNDGTTETDIAGATGSTYTLVSADVGKAIKVKVSFTDDAGNDETLTSAATAAVLAAGASPPNTLATGTPTISGTAQVGQTLTADTTGIADADGLTSVSYGYQWIRSDTDISGETASTYELSDDDVGKAIKVRVSFTDDAGNDETLTSAPTAAVTAAANNPATGQPTISGTAQVGETLTADTSGIADADGLDNASFTYQWMADDTDIDGATGSSHTLTTSEQGQTIQVQVSFTDDQNNEETLTSAATAAVAGAVNNPATGLPAISGVAQVGETLTADTSDIADSDGLDNASFSYQWVRNDGTDDADIQGATASTYTPSDEDVGKTIKVRVSFADEADNEETLTSAATAAVAARPNTPATGAPAISGIAHAGRTLTVGTAGIADADGLTNATFSYQWIANDGTTDMDIEDADGSTYTVPDDDVGKVINVRVSFTDDAGTEETLTGDPTASISQSVIYVVNPTAYPTNLVAEWKNGAVRLSWYAPQLDRDSITGYRVYRDSQPIVYSLGSGTLYRDQDATEAGSEYTYCVQAVRDGTNAGECSNHASITVPGETSDSTTPETTPDEGNRHPTNLTVSLVDGVVALTWDAPTLEAGSITGYEVLRRRPKNGEHTLVPYGQATGGTTFIDHDAIEAGVKYTYRVKALRGDEKSRWSNYANITIPK